MLNVFTQSETVEKVPRHTASMGDGLSNGIQLVIQKTAALDAFGFHYIISEDSESIVRQTPGGCSRTGI